MHAENVIVIIVDSQQSSDPEILVLLKMKTKTHRKQFFFKQNYESQHNVKLSSITIQTNPDNQNNNLKRPRHKIDT